MTSALLLFVSQTLTVMLLVVQSRLNTHGHNRLAAGNSLLIGASQLAMWHIMPNPSPLDVAAFLVAGPVGNIIAQRINRRDVNRIRKLHEENHQ